MTTPQEPNSMDPLWNDLVDEEVLNLLEKPDTTTDRMHHLLSSLSICGFFQENYGKDEIPNRAIDEPILTAARLHCPCHIMEPGTTEHFILRQVVNSNTSHSVWVVFNFKWGNAPYVLAYSTHRETKTCCEHVLKHPTPPCEIVCDEDFEPFERLKGPGFIKPMDYQLVAELLAEWTVGRWNS